MKKFVSILSLALVVVMLCATLVACGTTLSGTYEADLSAFGTGVKQTLEFSGSDVTMTVSASILGQSESKTFEGTYEITEKDDGTMTIKFDFGEDAEEADMSGEGALEIGEGYIKIDGIKYTEKK